MNAKQFIILMALCIYMPCFSQELVKSLQPAMLINFKSGFQVSDSIIRYYLTSSDSKYASHHFTYFIDHNLRTKSFTTKAVLDTTQEYSALTAAYDLFHVGLPDGSSILGSNGFECDITIADLALLNTDGTTRWALTWDEILSGEFITSIGMVKADILILNTESSTSLYFNLDGEQEFFGTDPMAYFNIASTNNYYFGTNAEIIYKLNSDFEIIDTYAGDTIRFFQKIDHDLFLVGTDEGISLMDTAFNIKATSFLITDILSGLKSGEDIWIVDHEGLQLLDINLNISKTYLPEPQETMKYVSAFDDTVYVASEYNGLYHRDFVLRKYLREDSLSSLPADIGITHVDLPDKIIREPFENYPYIFNLRFDSLGIEIFNYGEDTIHTCIVNCDWKVTYDPGFFCSYYTHEWMIDSLLLFPGESKLLQLGQFVPGPMYYGIIPTFCFWVDFPDEQPDINPTNDLLCMEGEIINHISPVGELNKITIYPNPAIDQLTIQNECGRNINNYFIYSISGELKSEFISPSNPVSVAVDDLIPGLYILIVQMKNIVEYHKFIKQ